MNTQAKIAELRKKINALDRELILLFLDRLALSDEIAAVKAAGNLAISDHGREKEVMAAALALAPASTKVEAGHYMRSIMAISKHRQHKRLLPVKVLIFPPPVPIKERGITVTYPNLAGTECVTAARQLFRQARLLPVNSLVEVLTAVKEQAGHYGVLPVENGRTGVVSPAYDLLRRQGGFIVGQTWVPDTPAAPDQQTRFIAVANQPAYDHRSDTISVTFSPARDSDTLDAALNSFMLAGLQFSRITAWPVTRGTYRFFADIPGNILDNTVASALTLASAGCAGMQILGCYTANTREEGWG
jgi:prephenate dehydratase/chorismate mutase